MALMRKRCTPMRTIYAHWSTQPPGHPTRLPAFCSWCMATSSGFRWRLPHGLLSLPAPLCFAAWVLLNH